MSRSRAVPLLLSCCFFLLPASLPALTPASERTFGLEDAVKLAILNNVPLLSAEQSIIIAQERLQEARFLFYPEFGFQANTTRFNVDRPFGLSPEFGSLQLLPNALLPGQRQTLYSARAFALYNLYSGRRGINTLHLARAALDQAKTDYEAVKMNVVADAKRVFARLLGAQEALAAVRAAVQESSGAQPAGLSGWEAVEAEGLLSRLRSLASDAERELDSARLEFLRTLNLELDTPLKLVGSLDARPVSVDPEKASLWAIELRPELRSQVFKAQIDAIQVSLAQSRRIPTVVLGADYELVDQDFPLKMSNYDITLGIRVPFSYTFWTELRQKRAEQRQGQLRRAELQDQVRLEVQQALQQLDFWRKAVAERQKALERVRTLAERAKPAPPSTAAALRGRFELLSAELAALKAVEEHNLALAGLERAVGREL